jgi:Ca2+-binding EF-hand superfamily protein
MNPMKPHSYRIASLLTAALALTVLPALRAHDHDGDSKFKMMDTDGDGRVSRAEHAAGAKQMFEQMDTNHDGYVTADEMEAFHHAKMAKDDDDKDRDEHAQREMSAAEKIKVIDTDGDGKISAAEHAAGSEKMFDKMDANHDGFLSKEEMEEGHKMMKKDQ